jgi:hypothetical protein
MAIFPSCAATRRQSVPAVILQDMPAKTIHRLIRSITWTEVDAVFAPHNVLRRFVLKEMRRTQDSMRRRAPYSLAQGPRIHLMLKIQTAIKRLGR